MMPLGYTIDQFVTEAVIIGIIIAGICIYLIRNAKKKI